MKALVLTGGGALGAYEAGVVCGLADAGEVFDLVCGTSIGAINAAFYAQGLLTELEQTWKSIASRKIIALSPEAQSVYNFIQDFEGVVRLSPALWIFHVLRLLRLYRAMGPPSELRSILGVLDRTAVSELLQPVLKIDSLKRSLIVTATNVTLQTAESFYAFVGPPGANIGAQQQRFVENAGSSHALTGANFLDVVEASSAIPFAFTPVNENLGTQNAFMYVDGGVANNTPIGLAVAAGASEITVIFLDPAGSTPTEHTVSNAADIGMACYSVMQQKILANDMKVASMTNKALIAGGATDPATLGLSGKVQIALRQVRPEQTLGLSVLGFGDQKRVNAAFDQGRKDAAQLRSVRVA